MALPTASDFDLSEGGWGNWETALKDMLAIIAGMPGSQPFQFGPVSAVDPNTIEPSAGIFYIVGAASNDALETIDGTAYADGAVIYLKFISAFSASQRVTEAGNIAFPGGGVFTFEASLQNVAWLKLLWSEGDGEWTAIAGHTGRRGVLFDAAGAGSWEAPWGVNRVRLWGAPGGGGGGGGGGTTNGTDGGNGGDTTFEISGGATLATFPGGVGGGGGKAGGAPAPGGIGGAHGGQHGQPYLDISFNTPAGGYGARSGFPYFISSAGAGNGGVGGDGLGGGGGGGGGAAPFGIIETNVTPGVNHDYVIGTGGTGGAAGTGASAGANGVQGVLYVEYIG